MTLSWSAARSEAHRQGALLGLPPETVALADLIGRTLAADLTAPGDVPGHRGAAMDGWVVAGEGPWAVGEPIVAGSSPGTRILTPGTARPVTTGAAVPPGAFAVVRSEDGVVAAGRLTLAAPRPVPEGRHLRPAGEEVSRGEVLFRAGQVLTPPRVALAAASGVDEAVVAVCPTVHLAVLGDEIVGAGVPPTGQVRDVFSEPFPSILRALGATTVSHSRVADDLEATIAALSTPGVRLVVTTGGTARSSADHVRTALERVGASLLIDRVAMRPGRPVILARHGDVLHLALPGNPMAATVGLLSLGVPLLDGLLGRPFVPAASVVLGVDVDNPRDDSFVLAYRAGAGGAVPGGADAGDADAGRAVPADRQTSAMLRGLTEADGLMVAPPGGAARGARVPSLPLPW